MRINLDSIRYIYKQSTGSNLLLLVPQKFKNSLAQYLVTEEQRVSL